MTEMAKGSVTHQRLIALLSQEGANFRVVTHEAVGKCEAVSEIRGTALGQGAKALVCKVKGNGVNQHVLAILAADQQADLSQLASHIGGLRASLASPAEVDELTGCVFGAIPPFSLPSKKNRLNFSATNTSNWVLPTKIYVALCTTPKSICFILKIVLLRKNMTI